jgi:hypothetical protein
MANILITEQQLDLITKEFSPKNSQVIVEAEWYNLVGDILGIADPTGIVDVVNGISYFSQGDHLFGLLSLISAIPYAGDVAAKPVMGALKIGSASTKQLKSALKLAELGKTAEASASLAKLAKEPGVVGKFLQSAKTWAPKVSSKVEKLPGGVLKGFKTTILDYLKLLENAGAKSVKFQKATGNLVKSMGYVVKPAENIKALQNILKNEKIFTGLTKKGPMSKIFLGGAPRLLGNREMRILMRKTKWWLGFLDYIGIGNFVGPEELQGQLGKDELIKKMNQYNRTDEAQRNAESDFPSNVDSNKNSGGFAPTGGMLTPSTGDPFQGFLSDIFGGNLKNAAMLAI